jgi:isoamylase
VLAAARPIPSAPSRRARFKDDIVYEVHVRGLTMNDTSVASHLRGTYAGAATKAAYLASLGITAVEFLPVQETQNDTNDVVTRDSTSGDNYWGYMTLNYFAPDRRYSRPTRARAAPTREFRGDGQGLPRRRHQGLRRRGLQPHRRRRCLGRQRRTYRLQPAVASAARQPDLLLADQRPAVHLGQHRRRRQLQHHNPIAQNLIVDSLAYWRDTLGVDGFRFDLASVLGNTCEHGCFNFDKMDSGQRAEPHRARDCRRARHAGGSGIDLIAEPWAIGGNSYQVGGFPSGWIEWNGKFRDDAAQEAEPAGLETVTPANWPRASPGSPTSTATTAASPGTRSTSWWRMTASPCADLYAYNSKQNNQAWPYGPSDGGEDNNHQLGPGRRRQPDQRKAARTGMAFHAAFAGVPMFTGGDELLRTQFGNNNTYNLDSAANWLELDAGTRQRPGLQDLHPAG